MAMALAPCETVRGDLLSRELNVASEIPLLERQLAPPQVNRPSSAGSSFYFSELAALCEARGTEGKRDLHKERDEPATMHERTISKFVVHTCTALTPDITATPQFVAPNQTGMMHGDLHCGVYAVHHVEVWKARAGLTDIIICRSSGVPLF
jgi:hypothetical protein